ncbi:MAG: nucleoside triphosphate pyrophosphohydrolase [Planctomycetota bacterium]|nr:nucleoside triphosphate pyrophosphohydrolase [Planctomycetota bacterium]MDA0917881.1 nucleoside triphosphate pyrophosphohydrolase [Planctomycetota bacterium]MDA1159751.1 nucleoside triphosphate pyrophosphohydrolase [Planctomycetota bacterium]
MVKDHDPATFGVAPNADQTAAAFVRLTEVIAKLRSPEGCPWDRQQTLATIKPYTLEETYELLEAIDSDDNAAICEELGDVLLQVVLDAQIAKDEQRFDIISVIDGITKKMIERHPHVFGDAVAKNAEDVSQHWDKAKRKEKSDRESVLDGIPVELPGLAKAARITKKAAQVGYDFPHRAMLFDKLNEEVAELADELFENGQVPDIAASVDGPRTEDEPVEDAARQDRIEGELGDVLFVIANIARRWQVNPEEALRKSNAKFERRFRYIETRLREQGLDIRNVSIQQMEELYQEGKRRERDSLDPAL